MSRQEKDKDFDESEELDEEEYEVEAIRAHRKRKGKGRVLEYYIKWKGYDSDDNTWENEKNVMAPLLLEEYWADKGGAEAREAARLGKSYEPKRESPKRRGGARKTRAESLGVADRDSADISTTSSKNISENETSTKSKEASKVQPTVVDDEEDIFMLSDHEDSVVETTKDDAKDTEQETIEEQRDDHIALPSSASSVTSDTSADARQKAPATEQAIEESDDIQIHTSDEQIASEHSDGASEMRPEDEAQSTTTENAKRDQTPLMSFFGSIFKKRRSPDSDHDRETDAKRAKMPASQETMVDASKSSDIEDSNVQQAEDQAMEEEDSRAQLATSQESYREPKDLPNGALLKTLEDQGCDDYIFDVGFPPEQDIDWEEKVEKVEMVTRNPQAENPREAYAILRWNDGLLSMHPTLQVRKKCPIKLIEFYEKHLSFSSY